MRSTISQAEKALDVELSDESEVQRFKVSSDAVASALRQAARDAGCRTALVWGPRGDLVLSVEVPR